MIHSLPLTQPLIPLHILVTVMAAVLGAVVAMGALAWLMLWLYAREWWSMEGPEYCTLPTPVNYPREHERLTDYRPQYCLNYDPNWEAEKGHARFIDDYGREES
jgi:hypothetical protein